MSKLTLLFSAFLCVSAIAGTSGKPDDEIDRLGSELAAARNARDAAMMKPGAKPTDPDVREKSAAVTAKAKELEDAFRTRTTAPRKSAAGTRASTGPEPTPAETKEPETVLSGERIEKEIAYPKKASPENPASPAARPSPKGRGTIHDEEPVPASSVAPDAAGLSEIRYPKKAASPAPR